MGDSGLLLLDRNSRSFSVKKKKKTAQTHIPSHCLFLKHREPQHDTDRYITMYTFALFSDLCKNSCIPLYLSLLMSGRNLGTNLHLAMVTPMMPHHFHGFRLLPSRPVTSVNF